MSILSRSSLTLTLAVLVAILLLSTIHALSTPRIRQSEQAWALENLNAVLPDGPYDNDPVTTQRQHIEPKLGSEDPLSLYTLFKAGKPVAAAMEIVARNGYNGDIKLLLGITYEGVIIGVRVLSHRETPGLADDIDIQRSNWITRFNQTSLLNLKTSDWDVIKHGGQFDAFTGATITPRAIIFAVHEALRWYEANRQKVFPG